ncbi:MAG: hypothetical protein HON78_04455 [Legionellales bacterium]|jgi:hypothetical protein|nr:hypothetical protein [Legionellales bacterium]
MALPEKNENSNAFLRTLIELFLTYSHIGIIDRLVPYLGYISAICLGLVQAALTYHFFPEILTFIAATLHISLAIQGSITYVVVAASFFTFFMLAKSVQDTNIKDKLTNSLNKNPTIVKTISVILVLVVIHLLELGLYNEFFLNLAPLIPGPAWISLVICGFAIANLLLFSIERTISTIDVFFEPQQTKSSGLSLEKITMIISMHIILFYALGVVPGMPVFWPVCAAVAFCLCYYIKSYDSEKKLMLNIDDILNHYVFLITHCAAEGGLVAAGIYSMFKSKYTAVLALVASTVCEELEDLVHDDGNHEHKARSRGELPEKILHLLNDMAKFNVLCALLLICVDLSSFGIATLLFGNVCYIASVVYMWANQEKGKEAKLSIICDHTFKKTCENIVFYACIITALCIGINGGLEFLELFGTSMYMVFFIAIAGAVVESSVLFDQIINKDSDEHTHGYLNVFKEVFNTGNILSVITLAIGTKASINFLLLFNLISPLNISFIFILAALMYGGHIIETTSKILEKNSNKCLQMLAICSLALFNIITIPSIFIHIGIFTLNSHIIISLLPLLFLMPVIVLNWNEARGCLSEIKIDNRCSNEARGCLSEIKIDNICSNEARGKMSKIKNDCCSPKKKPSSSYLKVC